MIEIKNITKIYKSKKRTSHKALDNISLTLPNSGLVFIIGKSGSGKSTLLNLLGGLDSVTDGSIIVDGNNITKYKENEFANYRNNHIGFIFQDYHLLDNLTVYENIRLSLNLNRLEDNGDVARALEKVGLAGYEQRFPAELSGGERQRVAIARAIVKRPYVILADEPTGNLDNVTATAIVELLKELSRDCLILIVSHNTIDTYKYADRIIKLSDGTVVSDETHNPEYPDHVSYVDDVMYYPTDATLTDKEIAELNDRISKGELRGVVARRDKYTPTTATVEARARSIDRKNLSMRNICKLCFTFLKSKVPRIALSSFIIAVIMVILALSETIIAFDSGKIIRDELKKMDQRSIFMEKVVTEEAKSELGRDMFASVTDADIEKFKSAGYSGEIYKVLNYNIPIDGGNNSIGSYENYFGQSSIYARNMLGTMIVDERFLTENFGDYEYVASAEESHPAGIVITDYLADVILTQNRKYLGKSYDDLIGEYYSYYQTSSRGYINAIIKTDYKEDFKGLLEDYGTKKIIDITALKEDERFIEYANAVYSRLGFAYTTNPNFTADFASAPPAQTVWHLKLKLDDHIIDHTNSMKYLLCTDDEYEVDLSGDEVVFSLTKYNEIFGTSYTASTSKDFVPHTVLLQQFAYDDYNQSSALMDKRIYVAAIDPKVSSTMVVSEELYSEFCENSLYTKGLYFYGGENMHSIIPVADQLNYKQQMSIIDGIHTMTKAVDVFVPIFELVAMVLCAGVVFILVNFSTRMIRDKMHDIGILKALGCKNSTIGAVFGLQLALIAVFTIILSSLGYFFFIDLANTVLIDSLKILADGYTVIDMKFLSFRMIIACINALAVIALTLVSFIIPMIHIYRIKPVKIIKAKE